MAETSPCHRSTRKSSKPPLMLALKESVPDESPASMKCIIRRKNAFSRLYRGIRCFCQNELVHSAYICIYYLLAGLCITLVLNPQRIFQMCLDYIPFSLYLSIQLNGVWIISAIIVIAFLAYSRVHAQRTQLPRKMRASSSYRRNNRQSAGALSNKGTVRQCLKAQDTTPTAGGESTVNDSTIDKLTCLESDPDAPNSLTLSGPPPGHNTLVEATSRRPASSSLFPAPQYFQHISNTLVPVVEAARNDGGSGAGEVFRRLLNDEMPEAENIVPSQHDARPSQQQQQQQQQQRQTAESGTQTASGDGEQGQPPGSNAQGSSSRQKQAVVIKVYPALGESIEFSSFKITRTLANQP